MYQTSLFQKIFFQFSLPGNYTNNKTREKIPKKKKIKQTHEKWWSTVNTELVQASLDGT